MLEGESSWVRLAVAKINADFNRSSDTHLIQLDFPFLNGCLYLKDESTHPTGSLKHRLARSLFLYGLCNGKIKENTPIIEASSGSTAISEAYFAKLLGLPFIAVIPKTTAHEKIALIESLGAHCEKVDAPDIYSRSEALAESLNGYYMDQFTYAERATDWRSNNNIAESIFNQMQKERYPVPSWIVVGAGTGGTSATIGRYIRYHFDYTDQTKLCVADVDHSVFYDYFKSRDVSLICDKSSRIEGIGRPRVEPSFNPDVVDTMLPIHDAASIAMIHWFYKKTGRYIGASTGTNLCAALYLLIQMQNKGETGSIVTLLCDSGERYLDSYYNSSWLEKNHLNIEPYLAILDEVESGKVDSISKLINTK